MYVSKPGPSTLQSEDEVLSPRLRGGQSSPGGTLDSSVFPAVGSDSPPAGSRADAAAIRLPAAATSALKLPFIWCPTLSRFSQLLWGYPSDQIKPPGGGGQLPHLSKFGNETKWADLVFCHLLYVRPPFVSMSSFRKSAPPPICHETGDALVPDCSRFRCSFPPSDLVIRDTCFSFCTGLYGKSSAIRILLLPPVVVTFS